MDDTVTNEDRQTDESGESTPIRAPRKGRRHPTYNTAKPTAPHRLALDIATGLFPS